MAKGGGGFTAPQPNYGFTNPNGLGGPVPNYLPDGPSAQPNYTAPGIQELINAINNQPTLQVNADLYNRMQSLYGKGKNQYQDAMANNQLQYDQMQQQLQQALALAGNRDWEGRLAALSQTLSQQANQFTQPVRHQSRGVWMYGF